MDERIDVLYEIYDALTERGVTCSIDSDHKSAELLIVGPDGNEFWLRSSDLKEAKDAAD